MNSWWMVRLVGVGIVDDGRYRGAKKIANFYLHSWSIYKSILLTIKDVKWISFLKLLKSPFTSLKGRGRASKEKKEQKYLVTFPSFFLCNFLFELILLFFLPLPNSLFHWHLFGIARTIFSFSLFQIPSSNPNNSPFPFHPPLPDSLCPSPWLPLPLTPSLPYVLLTLPPIKTISGQYSEEFQGCRTIIIPRNCIFHRRFICMHKGAS